MAQEQKYEACRGMEKEWREKEEGLLLRVEEAEEKARRAEDRTREAKEEAERSKKKF